MSWLPLLLPALLAASPSTEVARVGGAVLTRGDVVARLEFMRGTGDHGGALDALNGLIGERLLEQEGRRLGLATSPAVKARLEDERRHLAGQLLEERDLLGSVKVEEATLRTLYHSTADSVRLDLLLFDSEHTAAAAVARAGQAGDLDKGADQALKRNKGEAIIRAQLDPRLEPRAFAAPLGQVQGPLEASVGWAVFKVLERRVGDEAGFQAQRQALTAHAAKGLVAQARAHLAKQLRARQGVKLDEAFLESMPKGTAATPAQAAHVLATVGGRPIRYADVIPAVERITSARGHRASAALKIQVAWQEIDDRLLQEAAVERGYGDDPRVKALLPGLEGVAVTQAYAAQLTASLPPPSSREVAAFYEKHKGGLATSLERATPDIVAHLTTLKRNEAILAKVRELRGRAAVEIKQDVLNELAGGR